MNTLTKIEAEALCITEEEIDAFNDLVKEEEAEKIAHEINAIKRTTAQNVLASAMEIGRLLCEAKDRVPHGAWGAWLRDNVSYSVSNANNMMRLFRERQRMEQIDFFGNNDVDLFEGLGVSQAIALLDVPVEERKAFVEENDVPNMSVRELQAAIKAREEAEERERAATAEADELRRQNEEMEQAVAEANEELFSLKTSATGLQAEEKKKLEDELKAKYKAEADKKIEAAKKTADKKIEEARKESEEAAKQAAEAFEKEKEEIRAAERARVEAEAAERMAELENRLKAQAIAASPYLTEFKVHMEAFQREYRTMNDLTEAAEREDPAVGANLRSVLTRIKEALS